MLIFASSRELPTEVPLSVLAVTLKKKEKVSHMLALQSFPFIQFFPMPYFIFYHFLMSPSVLSLTKQAFKLSELESQTKIHML